LTVAFQTLVLVIQVTVPEPMASGVHIPAGIVLKLESWLSVVGVPLPETGICRIFISPLSAQMTLLPSLTRATGVVAVAELATDQEEHVPPPHVPYPHLCEQRPQLFVSLCRFAHVPLQFVCPLGQEHWPPEHEPPVGHAWPLPQAPQLLLDVSRFVSQPFEGSPSQSP
jgi:hypothetical protein